MSDPECGGAEFAIPAVRVAFLRAWKTVLHSNGAVPFLAREEPVSGPFPTKLRGEHLMLTGPRAWLGDPLPSRIRMTLRAPSMSQACHFQNYLA